MNQVELRVTRVDWRKFGLSAQPVISVGGLYPLLLLLLLMFRIALNTNRTRISTTTTPFLVKRRHAFNPWSVRMSTAAVSSKTNDSTTPTTTTTTTTPSKETVAAQTSAFQDLLGLTSPSPDLKNTFYQRQLPETLVRFSSNQGKRLFRSAMEAGHAEGFFPLTGNFTTQSEPAYCGPSSCKF